MGFEEAIGALNKLKQRKVIKDYVVIGAVAATAYMEPVFTEGLDIVVLVETDQEYYETFSRVAEYAEEMEGMHHIFGGIPVQMFPTTIKPLYRDALENARRTRIGKRRVKIASPEHLIIFFLEAFRDRDRIRIHSLLAQVDMTKLNLLLKRLDDDKGTLAQRLQTIQ
ncbi:MAG: nucleotidyltransferase [Chloroflexi bacterium]|nr:nucleotidyltransferase [Chloroflexota bacterium]